MKPENFSHVVLGSASAAGASLAIIVAAGTITTAVLNRPLDLHTIAFYAGVVTEVVLGALLGGVIAGFACHWGIGLSQFGKRIQLARDLAFFIPAGIVAAAWIIWSVAQGVFAGPSSSQFTNTLAAVAGIVILAIVIYSLRDDASKRREAKSEATMTRVITDVVAAALAQKNADGAPNQDSAPRAE